MGVDGFFTNYHIIGVTMVGFVNLPTLLAGGIEQFLIKLNELILHALQLLL